MATIYMRDFWRAAPISRQKSQSGDWRSQDRKVALNRLGLSVTIQAKRPISQDPLAGLGAFGVGQKGKIRTALYSQPCIAQKTVTSTQNATAISSPMISPRKSGSSL